MEIIKSLEILKDFGLSDLEIKTYLRLLEDGHSGAPELALALNIKRTTIYPILDRLKEQNIVDFYEQSNKKLYFPIRPNKLVSAYSNKLRSLIDIVPYLERLQSKKEGTAYGVKFIQSKEDLKKTYKEVLSDYKNKEYYVIGSVSGWLDTDREFFTDFRKKRAKNNTRVRLLLSHDSVGEVGQEDPSLLREYKYLPDNYDFKSTIDIYDDKIIIVGPEVKALCVVIAVPPMVDVFRSIFEILWSKLD